MAIERNVLIQQARERGIFLTRDRLAKWQQKGLIQPAKIVYGQGRGARSYYADDTLERVALIASLLQQSRDLNRVRLVMWRLGYQVNVRPVFESAVASIRELKREIDIDRAEVWKPRSTRVPLYERPVDPDNLSFARMLHKRFKVQYSTQVYLAYQLFDGDVALNEDEQAALSGLFAAFNLPLDVKNLGARLNELSVYLQPDALEEVLSVATSEALRLTDAQWRTVLVGFERLYNFVRLSLGKRSGEFFRFEDKPPDVQALAVLAWHSLLMRADLRERFEKLVAALEPLQNL